MKLITKGKYEKLERDERFWHQNWMALKEALHEAVQSGQISRELYAQLDDRSIELMRTKFWIEKRRKV